MNRFFLALLLLTTPAFAVTYWVDPVNGNVNRYDATKNPTGVANGMGTAACVGTTPNQNCPFGDVKSLWNILGVFADSAYVMVAGDTVRIKNCTATTGDACKMSGDDSAADASHHCWGIGITCAPPALPNGTSGNPITIESDTCAAGCGISTQAYNSTSALYRFQAPDPTKTAYIWGGNGAFFVLSVQGTQFVNLVGLDITDHSNCGSNAVPDPGGPSPGCSGTEFATYGIYFGPGGGNIGLTDLKVHGIQAKGIFGAINGPLTVNRVWVTFSGQTNWDFDDGAEDASSGGVTASYLAIQFAGCAEEYPVVDSIPAQALACMGQSNAGQGDGVGTPVTPLDFICDHCNAIYNVQDGFDIGHAYGGTVSFTNGFFYGNSGGNIKVGPMQSVTVYNNIIVSGCNRLSAAMTGAPSNYNGNLGDFCRSNTANGINEESNSNFLINAASTGTANISCTGTSCTSSNGFVGLTNGQHVIPATGTLAADNRTVSSVSSPNFTISSAFTSGASGVPVVVLAATPASTTVIHVYHNSMTFYPSGFDNQCQVAIHTGQAQGQVDSALCNGYVADYRNNIFNGMFDNNYNPMSGNHNPTIWPEDGPSLEDYNIGFTLNGTQLVGAHDIPNSSPLFPSQPATPMSVESVLDDYDFSVTSSNPAKTAGVVIAGQTADYFGNAWGLTPSMGASQYGGTPVPVHGAASGAVVLKGNVIKQ